MQEEENTGARGLGLTGHLLLGHQHQQREELGGSAPRSPATALSGPRGDRHSRGHSAWGGSAVSALAGGTGYPCPKSGGQGSSAQPEAPFFKAQRKGHVSQLSSGEITQLVHRYTEESR